MKTIGIIGFGNMGKAIGERISKDYSVLVFDKEEGKITINKANSINDLVQDSGIIIIAVKPQDFDNVIGEIYREHENKLIVSIAVGISTKYLESKLPMARVIRVMPNLPSQIGRGLSVISPGFSASSNDISLVEEIFLHLGKTLIIDEKYMNIVTAISGSGPGFYFKLVEGDKDILESFISSLKEISEEFGFSKEQARILAEETGNGSEAYLRETKMDPVLACQKVTSKGGTTEAGLAVLKDLNCLKEAVTCAKNRGEELGK